MCFAAIYEAGIQLVVYGTSSEDLAPIGFDDTTVYAEIAKNDGQKKIGHVQLMRKEALAVFEKWDHMT